jgi:hypothetical protein
MCISKTVANKNLSEKQLTLLAGGIGILAWFLSKKENRVKFAEAFKWSFLGISPIVTKIVTEAALETLKNPTFLEDVVDAVHNAAKNLDPASAPAEVEEKVSEEKPTEDSSETSAPAEVEENVEVQEAPASETSTYVWKIDFQAEVDAKGDNFW